MDEIEAITAEQIDMENRVIIVDYGSGIEIVNEEGVVESRVPRYVFCDAYAFVFDHDSQNDDLQKVIEYVDKNYERYRPKLKLVTLEEFRKYVAKHMNRWYK